MKRNLVVAGVVVFVGVATALAQPSRRGEPPRRGPSGWGPPGQAQRPPDRPGGLGEMIQRLRQRRLAELDALHGRRGRTEPRAQEDRRPAGRPEGRVDERRGPMMGRRHFGRHPGGAMMGRCPFGARRPGPMIGGGFGTQRPGPMMDRDRFDRDRRAPQVPQARRPAPSDTRRDLPDLGAELRRTVEVLMALQERVKALEERLGARAREPEGRDRGPDRRWDPRGR